MRRWLYTVADFDGDEVYVDEDGETVDRSDAVEHVATDADAEIEAERRADLWEMKNNHGAFVDRVTRHSQGKVTNENQKT